MLLNFLAGLLLFHSTEPTLSFEGFACSEIFCRHLFLKACTGNEFEKIWKRQIGFYEVEAENVGWFESRVPCAVMFADGASTYAI